MNRSGVWAAVISTVLWTQAVAAVPGYITSAGIGLADPAGKVPTINGVSGAGVANLDVPFPSHYLIPGNAYAVTISSENLSSFSGTCVTSYTLAGKSAGKPVVISSAKTKPYKCGKATEWAWYFITPEIPADPGTATLTAFVKYNTTTVKLVVPLTIQ